MEERKTVTVKLEIYEDQVEEFRALVYLLKNNLSEEKVERHIKSNYRDTTVFDKYIKSYVDFIRCFLKMIHVPSLDINNPLPMNREFPHVHLSTPTELTELGEKELEELSVLKDEKNVIEESNWDEASAHEYSEYPIGEEPEIDLTEKHERAISFIDRFIKDGKEITEKRQKDLARLITEYVFALKTENVEVDDLFLAAMNSTTIPKCLNSDLSHLVSLNMIMDFRYSSNVVLKKKLGYSKKEIKKRGLYLLAFDIYDRIKTLFKELVSENEEELFAITGFILSEIGHIYTEEGYEEESMGTSSWLSYIAKMTRDWVQRAEY